MQSIRIDIRKSEAIKEGKEVIGNRTKVKIVKNKVAPPFRSCVVEMLYGEGISLNGEILDVAVDMDLIKKAGSFYSYKGERIGQGRENARKYIIEHPDMFDELDKTIREKMSRDPDAVGETMVANEEASSEDEEDDGEFELDEETSTSTATTSPSSGGTDDNDITLEELEAAV